MDLDELLKSIREEGEPKGGQIIAAKKFFGEDKYDKYYQELLSEGRIEGDNLSPQEAIDMPRWKIRKDGKILIENGMEREVLETLAKLGHPLVEVPYGTYDFGASQVIVRDHEQYLAGSESRRDGIAVSF